MHIAKKVKIALAKMLQSFSELKVKDGENEITLISDSFPVKGTEVFISDATDEIVMAPNGEYIAEDGTKYVIAEGIVTKVTPKEEPKEEPAKLEEEPIKEEPTVKPLTIEDIVTSITPIIESEISKLKEQILSEVNDKLSKFTFSKPADLDIKDAETKQSTNKALAILRSK